MGVGSASRVTAAIALVASTAQAQGQVHTQAQDGSPQASDAPQVLVELNADDPDAALYRVYLSRGGIDGNLSGRLRIDYRREKVCVAPCGVPVEPGEYLVGGPGLRESPRFDLTGQNPRVGVDADTGSWAALVGGWGLAGLGIPATLIGATLVTWGLATSPDRKTAVLLGGGLAFAGGLTMTITGFWLIGDSKTTVELRPMAF